MVAFIGIVLFIVACFAFPPLGWVMLALIGLALIGFGNR